MQPFSIYIHIPFCLHKCPYCDFNTYALTSIPEKDYLAALLSELDYRATLAEWRARPVQSIYFGGGTPSLFYPASISKIITAICRLFPVDDQIEISLEANPGTVDQEQLSALKSFGVNRLSIGAQSFERDTLKVLGRMHSPEQTESAFQAARLAGFSNINLDLIYSVPGQSLESFVVDIKTAIKLAPEHISAYGLTIEKGTPFYQSYKRGLLKLPPEEYSAQMMEELQFKLPASGYMQYEISNFAKVGREARHNLAYWDGDDYLGLGAGAHSLVKAQPNFGPIYGRRWSNFALPNKYMTDAVANGIAESWNDTLKKEDAIFEFFFLGLRKLSGVSLAEFEQRFGVRAEEIYEPVLEMLKEQNLVEQSQGKLALTSQGIMLADSVIEQFADSESISKQIKRIAQGA